MDSAKSAADSGRSASELANFGRLCWQTIYLSEGFAADFVCQDSARRCRRQFFDRLPKIVCQIFFCLPDNFFGRLCRKMSAKIFFVCQKMFRQTFVCRRKNCLPESGRHLYARHLVDFFSAKNCFCLLQIKIVYRIMLDSVRVCQTLAGLRQSLPTSADFLPFGSLCRKLSLLDFSADNFSADSTEKCLPKIFLSAKK